MNEVASVVAESPIKCNRQTPFCCLGNEVFDVFLPLMGTDCLSIYALFKRKEFSNPKLRHTVRGLAEGTDVGTATVSRAVEILEYLGLTKITRFGGSRESECQLLDSERAAAHLGAKYNRKTLSYSLAPEIARRLKIEIKAIRKKQQGNAPARLPLHLGRFARQRSNGLLCSSAARSPTRHLYRSRTTPPRARRCPRHGISGGRVCQARYQPGAAWRGTSGRSALPHASAFLPLRR